MTTLSDLVRIKNSVTAEVEQAGYDHTLQRRDINLAAPELKHCYKSSTMFDREGSNEADS